MKLAIIDVNYSKERFVGLAATWLLWELSKKNIIPVEPEQADILLFTISSQQGVSKLRGKLRRIKNNNAKIVIGGGGCYAPAIFNELIDVACVGEGTRFIHVLLERGLDAACGLPEAWLPNETRDVIPYEDFPWNVPPLKHPDGTVRVFGSRGCKRKCLFCQTGWESSYRINPNFNKLQRQIDRLIKNGHRVALITNDGAEESIRIKGQQEFLSMTLDGLLKIFPITRRITKGVRIGVEGISERLRKAVGKPIRNEDLLNVTFNCLSNGVGVRWFFIPGLPGEQDKDYEELRWLVRELKKLPKGCVMMNFHSFIPQPATPLSILPLDNLYWERFDEFRRWFFHGPGFTRHVQIVAPCQYKGRLKRAKESMCATELELKKGWFNKKNINWRIKYPLSIMQLKKIAGKYSDKTVNHG